jgi:hypothetical protein
MIRSFDWRDLALLHRIRNRGICMDSQLAHTNGAQAMQSALRDALALHRNACTFVLRPENGEDDSLIGQFQIYPERDYARLTFLGPRESISEIHGIRLLEALAGAAGRSGALSIIAEIDEKDDALDGLRKAGFVIFARQRIWRLDTPGELNKTSHQKTWRKERNEDENAILHLHINLIPSLVQQVEPPGLRDRNGLVYWDDDELLGYFHIRRGSRGFWVQPYFHPAAVLSDSLLSAGFAELTAGESKPLFVCVRSYQGGIGGTLERLGFEQCVDEAVMVKRLAKPITQESHHAIPVLNGTRPEPTVPFIPFRAASHISHSEREL